MSSNAKAEAQWFGHPRGLATLFFTEMWERLGFYGMRAILLLFLVAAVENGGLGLSDGTGGAIYGIYVAGVYLMALPGGWVADRLIGQRSGVFVGGVILAVGYLTLGLPIIPFLGGALKAPIFFFGLLLVAIGTGLLKPNVSAIVGQLYTPQDVRRDAGFSLFYMGINMGAFFGPLVCGYLGQKVDWHLGFGVAGVGMVIGLIQYRLTAGYLGTAGLVSSDPIHLAERKANWTKLWAGCGALLGTIAVLYFVSGPLGLTIGKIAQAMGAVISLVAIGFFAFVLINGKLTAKERNRVIVIFLLFIGAALFWAGFEQAGTSMNLFAQRYTDLNIFGWEMPASWLQAVNASFIIIFAPIFGWLWIKLGKRDPSIPFKFGTGLVLLGAGFLYLAWGSTFIKDAADKVGLHWLILTYLLHTFGELCLSPVGLSSVTKLSPQRFVGQMMGIWFLGSSLGNLIAGLVGGQLESMPMSELFGLVALVVMVAGGFFLIFTPVIKKLIGQPAHTD